MTTTNKILIGLGVLGLAAFAYYVYTKNKEAATKTAKTEDDKKIVVEELPSLYPPYIVTDIYAPRSRHHGGGGHHHGGGGHHAHP